MSGMFDVTLILEDIVKRDGVSRNANRYDATTEQLIWKRCTTPKNGHTAMSKDF